ncbi:ubiquitin carboxyl-terminal hydrolase 21-like isoform X2 [Asparagus officinalis]|nr:ubiquitin carboxyl-terminal hydrolase 21-like isoform X2 [Asparagus officinalis]
MESPRSPSPIPGFEPNLTISNPNDENEKTSNFSLLLSGSESYPVGSGLRNIGNTCYLNSVLQCVIHTVPLVEKLRSFDHDHPYSSGYSKYFCSLCALRNLVASCMANPGWSIAPYDFTDNLRKISFDFELGLQQDAHEFYHGLLDNLHNSCLDPSSKDHPLSMEKNSLIKDIYGGISISQLKCTECGHCSNTPEPLLDLSLEIADADTLKDALESFTKVERIEETKFTCEGCKLQVLMDKQTKIDHAPPVISLHLKRFRNDGVTIDKIDKFVEYPLELDLRPFICYPKEEEQTVYDLYAVLVHEGTASYGHYYSLVRSSPTIWHRMDDSMVTRASEAFVVRETAYILFYIKKGSSPWFSSLMEAETRTSPTSVLDDTIRVQSPSSADETSPEKEEEAGPCPTVPLESPEKEEEAGPCPTVPLESPSTTLTCENRSHPNEPHNAMTSRFRPQNSKRSNPDHSIIDIDECFQDEPLEDDEKENHLIPRGNIGSRFNKEEVKTSALEPKRVPFIGGPLKRLVRGMPSLRRSSILACLPPNHMSLNQRSPLTSKTPSLNKKRRTLKESSMMDSSRSLSPGAVRRGLFGNDSVSTM